MEKNKILIWLGILIAIVLIIFFFPKGAGGGTCGFCAPGEYQWKERSCFGIKQIHQPTCLDCTSSLRCYGIVYGEKICYDSPVEPRTQLHCGQVKKIIPFETIGKGAYSGYTEKANLVLHNSTEFEEIWGKTFSIQSLPPEVPEINFDDEVVIAVFMGEKNTGGYSISIGKIVDESIPGARCPQNARCIGRVVVYVKETKPTSALVTEALTDPYHIVKLKKIYKPFEFVKI